MQLQDQRHNSESYSFGVMPHLTKILSRMMTPDKQALVPHAVFLLFDIIPYDTVTCNLNEGL